MTITYMFHAKDRPSAKAPAGSATEAELAEDPAIFVPHPRFRISEPPVTSGPVPAAADDPDIAMSPLLLVNPAARLQPEHAPTPDPVFAEPTVSAAPPAQQTEPAPPVHAGLPVRYERPDSRLILVAKARGGIGATTLAVNLAVEMQMQGAKRAGASGGRVALVDLDIQLGNAGSFLDLADRGGMLALARLTPEPDVQAVRHAIVRHPSGLSVLAAPSTAIPFEALDATRIASILDALIATHDVVIVDLPPALIDWLGPVLQRAERMLMVTDLAVPSITRARRIITMMTEDRPDLPVEIVVAHEKKPFRMGQMHRDAATALGHDLRHWLPDETKLARQAIDRGEALVQLAPRSGWSKAVRQMAMGLQTPTIAARKDR
jgi:MinD-like ATPase involved in chromosome partitioning or flagellar assembly